MIWTASKDAKLQALLAQGLSTSEVGDCMGVSADAVRGRRNKLRAGAASKPDRSSRDYSKAGPPEAVPLADCTAPTSEEHIAHLRLIYAAKPQGFTWASPWLVFQLGKAERAPKAGSPFWRPA